MTGPTWKPLTSCEGDYLRFYSPPIPSVTREGAQDRLQHWHWNKKKLLSFTFKLKRWLWERSDSITLTDLTSASAGRRRPTSLLAWRTSFLFSLGGENKNFDVFLNFLFIKLFRSNLDLDLIRWLKICFMRIKRWTCLGLIESSELEGSTARWLVRSSTFRIFSPGWWPPLYLLCQICGEVIKEL